MRRSLISVAGANSRAGKAQISVAGDLLASLNPVNLQQKVNEFQRGVGLSSLRGVAFATNTQNTHPQTPSAREGALKVSPQTSEGAFMVSHAQKRLPLRHCEAATADEAIHYATESRFEDTNSRIKNAPKARNGLLRYARNDEFPQNRQDSLNTPNNLNSSNSLNSLNLKTPPRSGFSAFGLSGAFDTQNAQKSGAFATITQNTHPQSRCAREGAFSRFRVNFMEKFTQKAQKALAVSAAAAFCVALSSVSASAEMKTSTSITTSTTINGTTGLGYNVSSSPGNAFYKHNTDRNGIIGWRNQDNVNTYISFGGDNQSLGTLGNYFGTQRWGQNTYGVVTKNSAGTLYVIENKADGWATDNWTAFGITGGTTTVTGSVNNIVFASYRHGQEDRNRGQMNSTADRLFAVSNGATLNIGQSGGSGEIRIGFGNYGSQQGGGVYIRKDYHPTTGLTGYSGSFSTGTMGIASGNNGTVQSMHSWKQNVIEVTGGGSRINFYQNTYIVTTLDSTISEPWKGVVNFSGGGDIYLTDGVKYKDYDWGRYYAESGSRALYVGNSAISNIAGGVTVKTYGTIEFNTAGTFTNNGTLETMKHTTWGQGGGNMIFTNTYVYNSGTIKVGRDLSASNITGSKYLLNEGTISVAGNANLSSVQYRGGGSLTVTGALSMSNTNVSRYMNSTSGAFTVTGNLSMSNSTFDGTGASLTVTGNSNFTGTNVFIVNGSKVINLGNSVSTTNPLNVQVVQTQSENRAWAAGVAAKGTAQNVGGKTLRVGTQSYNSTLLQTNSIVGAYNTSNIKLMKNSSTALATGSNLEYIVNTSTGAQINEYSIQRNFGYGANLTYTNAIVTDLLYDPNSGGGGGGGGGTVDPTPKPTDPEYIVPETTTISANERTEVAASANLQGMIDVHFLLSQFELMNKYQTNFNPDEFINNARVKRQTVKYRVGRNAKNAKKRIIKRVQRTLAPYDYSIWADAQYSQVSFTNGITYNGDAAGMSEYKGKKQVLETSSINGKVGLDLIGSRFDGYVRGYFGYNLINAENTTYGNQYDGSSYEVGAQLMSGLDLLGVEFQGYADIGYAYNSVKVETGTKEITASDIGTFDLDTNTHNIKAGLGVEKRFKIIGNADVGVGVDLDYVFSLGKEFKATAASTDDGSGRLDLGGEWKTPKQNHHYLITGAKAFAGYNIKRSNTYLYLQGTYGYQLLEQDEFINLDQVGGDNLKMKVKNAAYQNHLATAGVGLSQKLARNFNFHLQATKLFSNNYTNDSFQVRGQVSYKW